MSKLFSAWMKQRGVVLTRTQEEVANEFIEVLCRPRYQLFTFRRATGKTFLLQLLDEYLTAAIREPPTEGDTST